VAEIAVPLLHILLQVVGVLDKLDNQEALQVLVDMEVLVETEFQFLVLIMQVAVAVIFNMLTGLAEMETQEYLQ
jgi:hypothetical protein